MNHNNIQINDINNSQGPMSNFSHDTDNIAVIISQKEMTIQNQ